jgi:hypothetical protein
VRVVVRRGFPESESDIRKFAEFNRNRIFPSTTAWSQTTARAAAEAVMAKQPHAVGDKSARASRDQHRWCGFDPAQTKLAMALFCFLWVPLVGFHEHLAYRLTSWSCTWPELGGSSSSPATHVAVIADPQLSDFTSYPAFARKGTWTLGLVERICDAYMHRAFRHAVLAKKPDHVLFLGDLLDGGWQTGDPDVFDKNAKRFERVFRWQAAAGGGHGDEVSAASAASSPSSSSPSASSSAPKKHHLSVHGNHDVGYSAHGEKFPSIQTRHEKRFGGSNYVVQIGGVDVIGVNAMALDGDEHGRQTKETWRFVDEIGKNKKNRPRVLVTHLPLARDSYHPNSCGPDRFGPVIQPRFRNSKKIGGVEYQDYLSPESTTRLLNATRPVLVLAGHDHDRCEFARDVIFGDEFGDGDGDVTKTKKHGEDGDEDGSDVATETPANTDKPLKVTELTLGTFSWLMGNPKPSFTLLSLVGDDEKNKTPLARDEKNAAKRQFVATKTCELPEHLSGVWRYASCGAVSTFLLLILPSIRVTALFMRSDGAAIFARKTGVAVSARVSNGKVGHMKTWLALVTTAAWRHCGPFVVLVFVVLSAIGGGTLLDLARV